MSYGIPQSFVGILRAAGASLTTLGGQEWCCGYPLLMAGQLAQARALMAHNLEQVRSMAAARGRRDAGNHLSFLLPHVGASLPRNARNRAGNPCGHRL